MSNSEGEAAGEAEDAGTESRSRLRRVWRWLRDHSTHALLVAVAAAVVGGVVPVLLTGALQDWLSPPAPAPATCPGAGCDGKDPQKEGCSADAVTWLPPADNPVSLQVRRSKRCGVVWGRITSAEVGDVVTVRVEGGSARSAVVEYGKDQYTPMVSVGETFRATACAEPTISASRTGRWSKYCIVVTDATAWK
ncbi:DUF2690 domain-containing protein [Streptomyces paromomycinus]|uniref:DUF2690 domain-containing protein n=1 Tax=Streptomyces paromomycinus TaxID=92743 RepID=A0A401WFH2_STREY|nr:DUF2690 domain-containing protein [Streptomyces paromomycinus]GCD48048.1 hypothetical protein GKJPGBOP_07844 [Streptomyces paromomycinus]